MVRAQMIGIAASLLTLMTTAGCQHHQKNACECPCSCTSASQPTAQPVAPPTATTATKTSMLNSVPAQPAVRSAVIDLPSQ